MTFIDKTEKLKYLLKLIEEENTGNSDKLSRSICVSKRTLFRYIDDLRSLGNEISYCLRRETYHFIEKDKNKKII